MSLEQPTISRLGTTALLFDAPGETSLPTQQRIWALALEVERWPEIRETVPGMNNLMVGFARRPAGLDEIEARLLAAWAAVEPLPLQGRVVELPVTYGGPAGPHLQDVLDHTGLDIDAIVAIHTEPLYPIYALGSHPGYCYLGGMDLRIATPRRKVPALWIPGGSVSIGGEQTGVSASAGPSGWNTIGRTDRCFFDPNRDPPALFRPGDSVRFCVERVIR